MPCSLDCKSGPIGHAGLIHWMLDSLNAMLAWLLAWLQIRPNSPCWLDSLNQSQLLHVGSFEIHEVAFLQLISHLLQPEFHPLLPHKQTYSITNTFTMTLHCTRVTILAGYLIQIPHTASTHGPIKCYSHSCNYYCSYVTEGNWPKRNNVHALQLIC